VIQGEVQDENCHALGGVCGYAGLFSNALTCCISPPATSPTGVRVHGRHLFQSNTIRLFATRQAERAGTTRALGWDTPSEQSSLGRYFSKRLDRASRLRRNIIVDQP
jgi:serine-type D-Ala-D-Ala carboxypeptidase